MDVGLKKILKPVTLALRHLLEGEYDSAGQWKPGDLERRLAALGVRRDRASVPTDELEHLPAEDRHARKVVDAYIKLREEAGVARSDAVAEFIRETAYTWANRLIALRCMEARELIDPVILQQEAYGGRSLEHHRLAQRQPELCAGEDDGLFAVLDKVFREQTKRLPMLFDPQAPGIALRPSAAAIKDCFGLLSLTADVLRKYRIRIKEDETASADAEPPNPFVAPDALGWTYQYWNTEEKDRVFERVRTVKGAKIAGSDIVPATQLYTEDYMVKFLVQNSLGATWMIMHPESKLSERWEYYVRDADRAPADKKPVRDITFLDPACGSGHFLLEAFDLYYAMYEEEGEISEPSAICTAILTRNLFGIDIDARAVQIAEAALWMKAAERVFDFDGSAANLVAATSSHLKGPAWEEFLAAFTKEPSVARVLRKFAETMEHIDEIGSLARPAEDLRAIIKEEHATWERQVSEQKEANFLFPEMRKEALSGQLAFDEITDDDFSDRLFYRAKAGIDAFTEQARESGDFDDQMLASETQAGFRLVDLLSRRYDVVATNPPWMGSKNMGPAVKRYLERHYVPGKRDVYAAFILRSLESLCKGGRVGMITQQSWLFLNSYSDLRHDPHGHGGFGGLLKDTAFEVTAQLGRYAFSELGNGVIQPQLFVLRKEHSDTNGRITCFRLSAPRVASEQASLLSAAALGMAASITSRPRQKSFLEIPNSPLSYWLRRRYFELLAGRTLGDVADLPCGPSIGDTPRFVRYHWESPPKPNHSPSVRWVRFDKGGGYKKWAGFYQHVLDWEIQGARIKSAGLPGTFLRNEGFYFSEGWVFSSLARGSLGLRLAKTGLWGSVMASPVIPKAHCNIPLGVIANSRISSASVRWQRPQMFISEGYVARIPVPLSSPPSLYALERTCVSVKDWIVSRDLNEHSFYPCDASVGRREAVSAVLHAVEGIAETQVFEAYQVSGDDLLGVLDETGTPAGWQPLITGHDAIPELPESLLPVSLEGISEHPRRQLSTAELDGLKDRLRIQYAAGFGGRVDDDDEPETSTDVDDESDETAASGARVPIPAETFIEELSNKLEIHPISVYWLLKDGRERDGWRCPSEERRLMGDRLTVLVLRMLGHRWPRQIEAVEPLPEWADQDGIIPLAPGCGGQTLISRVNERIATEFPDSTPAEFKQEFTEAIGQDLDTWLTTEFFKHHTKQFRKRPITWQIQSGNFSARRTPAFACLVYYHKLDTDLLRKTHKMAEDLRKSRETEQRGILSIAPDARSDRQEARRVELEDAILELQRFDTTLANVSATGFGPPSLHPTLRQYGIDDAMLTLKACWLRRLGELIGQGPLPDWLAAADRTGLHAEFRSWVANAMAHLDHFCAEVGPRPPDQGTVSPDPTAADLAGLIAPHAATMLADALERACDVWWDRFDTTVLAPLKERLKEIKAEQKSSEQQLAADTELAPSEARRLTARIKELKADAKELTALIKEKTARATSVRVVIESWRSDEPPTWGGWLAGQPLFDQISSLDDRRPAPKTIAEFIAQESLYAPDINDGVRVNIAPLQKAGLLAADVLAAKDLDKAIADRASWRADERRWVREGKLPRPGWWDESQIERKPTLLALESGTTGRNSPHGVPL